MCVVMLRRLRLWLPSCSRVLCAVGIGQGTGACLLLGGTGGRQDGGNGTENARSRIRSTSSRTLCKFSPRPSCASRPGHASGPGAGMVILSLLLVTLSVPLYFLFGSSPVCLTAGRAKRPALPTGPRGTTHASPRAELAAGESARGMPTSAAPVPPRLFANLPTSLSRRGCPSASCTPGSGGETTSVLSRLPLLLPRRGTRYAHKRSRAADAAAADAAGMLLLMRWWQKRKKKI